MTTLSSPSSYIKEKQVRLIIVHGEHVTDLSEDEFRAWLDMFLADQSWGDTFSVRRVQR